MMKAKNREVPGPWSMGMKNIRETIFELNLKVNVMYSGSKREKEEPLPKALLSPNTR